MLAVLMVLVLAAALVPKERDSEQLLVPRRTFDCFVRDIQRLRVRDDRIRIDIRSCPSKLINGYVPPDDAVELILDLDTSEVNCIRRNRRQISNFSRIEGSYYRIDLKNCRPPVP